MNADYPFELASAINGLSYNVRTIPDRFSYIRAPGYLLLDVNLKKEFTIVEGKTISFRVDASNILNKCNWLNVNAGVTSPDDVRGGRFAERLSAAAPTLADFQLLTRRGGRACRGAAPAGAIQGRRLPFGTAAHCLVGHCAPIVHAPELGRADDDADFTGRYQESDDIGIEFRVAVDQVEMLVPKLTIPGEEFLHHLPVK